MVNNTLLASTAQSYHGMYAAEIAYRMSGCKHLSILMPSLMGTFPIIPNVYDFLNYRDREFVIVESQEQIEDINNTLFNSNRDTDCIYPILVDDFINQKPDGDCYILLNLTDISRRRLSEILVAKQEKLVISVGRLSDEQIIAGQNGFTASHTNEILSELHEMTLSDGEPHCMVFEVGSILDIRDIAYANTDEKDILLRKLYDVSDAYERDLKHSRNALDKNDKLIMFQKAQEILEFQNEFLRMIAATAGVKVNELDECLETVKRLKQEYAVKFDNTVDEDEIEALETEFQTIIAEESVKVTKSLLTLDNKERYEQMLIESLTESVWNKLTKHSQMYLISAMMTFDSLSKMKDKDSIDFSGVCLQVTKVLDEEMALRLYDDYKVHLSDVDISNWPRAMREKDRDGNLIILPEHKFTIGSIAKVIGYNVKRNKVEDKKSFESMKEYAKTKLYMTGASDSTIEKNLISIAVCAEKTRNDYRNPSAHRNTMPYISAKDCIAYLVEQTKMLKEIMKDMRY